VVYDFMSTTRLHDLYRSTEVVQDCMGPGVVQGYNVQK